MFQRFQAKKEGRESGFTLIELLVVIIIIAILAAIAIPVFLKQREKGWKSQAESGVKNAATAMESLGTENGGSYDMACGTVAVPSATDGCAYTTAGTTHTVLTAGQGLKLATDVTLTVIRADATGYCLSAAHANVTAPVYYSSSNGAPSATVCT